MKEIRWQMVLVVLRYKWYFCLMGAALEIPESKESVANAKGKRDSLQTSISSGGTNWTTIINKI